LKTLFKIALFGLVLCLPSLLFGGYTVTVDPDLDYYESLADSGVTVPMTHISSPTAENLRDALIAAGLMDAAPIIVVYPDIVHEDRPTITHADRAGIVHEDHLQ
jgi:hypothetical protein